MDPITPNNDLRHLLNSGPGNPSNETLTDLANSINSAFLAPMQSFQPLVPEPIVLDRPNVDIRTTEYSVFVQLSQLNSSKAPGPDGLPSWFLKENADVLAKPVSDILLHIGRVVFLCLGKWQTCHHSPSKNLYRT